LKLVFIKYQTFAIACLLLLSACGTLKHAEKPLLIKNKIVLHGEKFEFDKDELEKLITQKPNKSFLGLWRFKLYSYQLPDRGKPSKFRQKMREKLGEPPVYYDPRITNTTMNQMRNYLNKSGYFNSKVWESQKKSKQKVKLYYNFQLASPYKIRNINRKIKDTTLARQIETISSETLLKSGDIYNAFILDNERDRITKYLKNNGYFNFNQEYIYYTVDSTLNSKQLDITLIIKNIENVDLENPSYKIEENHKQFHINNVYVNPEYDLLNQKPDRFDTTLVKTHRDTARRKVQTYHFLLNGKPRIRPKAITNSILIRPNEYFSLNNVKVTYRRLADLRNFKYSNIQFNDVSDSVVGKHENLLDCFIDLSRTNTHSYTIEAEGTNSGGDLGIGINLAYNNKNIFRGAEILEVRFSTSMEAQQINSNISSLNDRKFLFFNTIEAGVDVSLRFPKFLIPINPETFPQNFKPRTNLTTGFNYQQRPNYRRYITKVSFGYDWSQDPKTRHILNPIEISSVKVFREPEFDQLLEQETNERVKSQYTDHLISALKYSFIYNSQELNKHKDFIYIRANFETSGFLLKGMHTLFKTKPDEGKNYNSLFGIRYAQYVRADIDFRYYNILSPNSKLVYRVLFGIGYPYGNSDVLPFEKGFFAGGANGMRGWGIRSLGPGSYHKPDVLISNIDRIGDLRLELNFEYRFPLYKRLKGALFVDAGNVWQIKDNTYFLGGRFAFGEFWKEIALDAGLGFRLDFSFFVFRIDAAWRLRDPDKPLSERWVIDEIGFKKIVWNFGIGYPF
jgi:outer membrane protein assembly factor BamA